MIPVIKRERGKALPPGAVYVGRGSRWGNPYRIGPDGTREEVIDLYRAHIAARPDLVEELRARKPAALACWCAPLPCHADVLAELLETAATVYHYRLPLPPRGVGGNARDHWSGRARATREYRAECAEAYRAQGVPDEPHERVHVAVEMRVCRKRVSPPRPGSGMSSQDWIVWNQIADRYRPRDEGNVHDACKAALDALQPARWVEMKHIHRTRFEAGAGVVVGDDSKHMTLDRPRLVEVQTFGEEGVFVTVEVQGG